MPRTIEIALSPDKTDPLLERLQGLETVTGLSLQRGASLDPPGDIITAEATNEGTRAVLDLVAQMDVLQGGSVRTTEPRSLLSPPYQNGIEKESNETIWEEMAFLLRRDTNMSVNYLSLMALSGGVAAVGLWTDTLHIVIGAMVIAPGFEPLLRIPFGFVAGPRVLASRGLLSSVVGYLLLALGAALTLLLLQAIDLGQPADLEARSWVRYWSEVTPSGALLSFLAGLAGAMVVTAQRPVLSAGVMIALALIPAASIAGMALIAGDPALAGRGLVRWSLEVAAVILAGALVLGLKQTFLHRRNAVG